MKPLVLAFLVCLFLLAKVPPVLGLILTLAALGLVGYVVHGALLGAWRLLYYGGRNQKDKARNDPY
jgi:hypothetical protein